MDSGISEGERIRLIKSLEGIIARMKKMRLLAGKNDISLWGNRLARLTHYHYKYLTLLISKIWPLTFSVKTFFHSRIFFRLPEQYYFLMWGFFPEIEENAETNLTKFLIKNLKSGEIFFDLGANCGFYSILARYFVGAGGQVHSFEPTPSTFELLRKTKGNFANIYINNLAVYSKSSTIDFYLSEFSVGNTIQAPADAHRKTIVPTISLNEYCDKVKAVPTFIKIDVEGSEEKVLEGAQNILKNHSPLIAMEMWRNDTGIYKNAFGMLRDRGYMPYWINDNGDLLPIMGQSGQVNFEDCFKESNRAGYENLLFKKLVQA